jgi:zeaxanthin glucosyltransferase
LTIVENEDSILITFLVYWGQNTSFCPHFFCIKLSFNTFGVPPINSSWSYSPAWWAQLRNQFGYQLLSRITQPVVKTVAEYRQEWNLPPHLHPNDTYSKLAQICQQPAGFEFPRQHLPQCFHFTGPYSSADSREPASFPFEKLTGQPLIYASMGTLQNRLSGVFENIA